MASTCITVLFLLLISTAKASPIGKSVDGAKEFLTDEKQVNVLSKENLQPTSTEEVGLSNTNNSSKTENNAKTESIEEKIDKKNLSVPGENKQDGNKQGTPGGKGGNEQGKPGGEGGNEQGKPGGEGGNEQGKPGGEGGNEQGKPGGEGGNEQGKPGGEGGNEQGKPGGEGGNEQGGQSDTTTMASTTQLPPSSASMSGWIIFLIVIMCLAVGYFIFKLIQRFIELRNSGVGFNSFR